MRLLPILLSLVLAAPAMAQPAYQPGPGPVPAGASTVTATGGTTARTIADWFWGIDKSGASTLFNGAAAFNFNSSAWPDVTKNGLSLAWNHTASVGEVDFFNTFTSNPASSFRWYQMTGASAGTQLMDLGTSALLSNVPLNIASNTQTTIGTSASNQASFFTTGATGRILSVNRVGSTGADSSVFSTNYNITDTGGTWNQPQLVNNMTTNVATTPIRGVWNSYDGMTSSSVGGNVSLNGNVARDFQAIRNSNSPIGKTTVSTTLGAPSTTVSVADLTNLSTGYYPYGSPNVGQSFSMLSNPGVGLLTSAQTASGSYVLTFTSTAGIYPGMIVFGNSNIPKNTAVQSVTTTTVTLNAPVTGTVASGAGVNFQFGMRVKIGTGQYTLVGTSAASGAGTITTTDNVSIADATSGNTVLSQQGGSPLWAFVASTVDQTGLPSSAAGVDINEIDISGNDVDDGDSVLVGATPQFQGTRAFVVFNASAYNQSGAAYQVGKGLSFHTDAMSSIGSLIYPNVNFYKALLDGRPATQMTNANAIWLADGQTISLNTAGTIKISNSGVQVPTFTVATLPTCSASNAGTINYVTDATAPTYNGTLTGGSTVKTLSLCNGTAWTAH